MTAAFLLITSAFLLITGSLFNASSLFSGTLFRSSFLSAPLWLSFGNTDSFSAHFFSRFSTDLLSWLFSWLCNQRQKSLLHRVPSFRAAFLAFTATSFLYTDTRWPTNKTSFWRRLTDKRIERSRHLTKIGSLRTHVCICSKVQAKWINNKIHTKSWLNLGKILLVKPRHTLFFSEISSSLFLSVRRK
jgi:hypothetical protein